MQPAAAGRTERWLPQAVKWSWNAFLLLWKLWRCFDVLSFIFMFNCEISFVMNIVFLSQGMYSIESFSCCIHISGRRSLMSLLVKAKSVPVHTWSCLRGATINGKFHDGKPFFVISVLFVSQPDSFFWAGAATGRLSTRQKGGKLKSTKCCLHIDMFISRSFL